MQTNEPTYTVSIEGQQLNKDITQEIMSFTFEDDEEALDLLELQITNRFGQFTDDPLFQEGNEIAAQFGYVGNLSPTKRAVIKDIQYRFPENGAPTITLKAYDKGYKLAGKARQKVWQKAPPGILYSDIATKIAGAHGLTAVIKPTKVYHLRVTQANQSDAQFLQHLAPMARDRDGDGVTGYVFYVQDEELHFHPRALEMAPAKTLEYFTDTKGLLRSFTPITRAQGAKGAGLKTRAIGIDPRKKAPITHDAQNDSTTQRTSLGQRTYLVDGESGETSFKDHEAGAIIQSPHRTEAFHKEPTQEPAQDLAEGFFKEAELRQIQATAITLGIPTLKAKHNVEIKGVGAKFSGIYYIRKLRHVINAGGYHCALTLKKNAIGHGAGTKSDTAKGQINDKPAPKPSKPTPPVKVNAESGQVS